MAINKEEILFWVGKNFQYSCQISIDDDGLISVTGDCYLVKKLNNFSEKFYKIGGHFNCNDGSLTSLIGSPRFTKNFECSFNEISSLIGSPTTVDGMFDCCNNRITSLKGAPDKVVSFNCMNNSITYFDCGTK